jgi:hypothetical protein
MSVGIIFTSGSMSTFLPAARSKANIFIIADTAYAFQKKEHDIKRIKFRCYKEI